MDDNFNNSSMAGKVVSVLIALLFIVVLAFPIANSLGNTDNGGGSGDSSGTEYINEGTAYYTTNGKHTLQIVSESTNIDTEDFTTVYTVTIDGDVIDEVTLTTESYKGDPKIIGFGQDFVLSYAFNSVDMKNTWYYHDWLHEININGKYSKDFENAPSLKVEFDNGTVVCTNGYDESEEYSKTGVNLFRTSTTDREYVLCDSPIVTDTSEIYVYGVYEDDSTTVIDFIEQGRIGGFTSLYNPNYDTITLTLNNTPVDGAVRINSIEYRAEVDVGTEDEYIGEGIAEGIIVPVNVHTGSGSDSGTSVDGIAGTLIKLVPILMIIGLLMIFIIPMVYKPN